MSFLVPRKKTTLIKALVLLPVCYFAIVGFLVTIGGRGIPEVLNDELAINKRDLLHDVHDGGGGGDSEVKKWDSKFHNPEHYKLRTVVPQRDPLIPPVDQHVENDEHIARQIQINDRKRHEMRRQQEERQNDLLQLEQNQHLYDGAIHKPDLQLNDPNVFHVTHPPDYNANAPGELGKAVTIKKEQLSAADRKVYDLGWQRNAFNQYASDMISMRRTLPDVRDPQCKKIEFPPYTELPDASVIIIFHNEAWSVLLRTVYSVLDRSPPHLIKEVILVDDFSDFDHLLKPLEDYVAKNLTKVRVVRGKKREGLIRARLLGASVAKGKVLTFLDSHCECTEGWLEPLLARIAEDKSNVVTPVIDVVDDETLRYQYSSAKSTSVGGFDWNLQFNWHAIPEKERKRRKHDTDPVRSPTMAGGLFAIHRDYFEYLGSYDPGMDIWGGENLELSFRVWMCGGTLEIMPCSHVGHIFRKRSPYSWKTGVNVVKKNSIRLAEVWMDEYKNYYYERFNYELGEYGDVSARKDLRKRLNCRSFQWYIENVFPDLFVPGEAVASGEIRNKMQAQCLDSPVDSHSMQKPIKMWPCHKQGGNQYWMLSKNGEIRRDEGCMDYAGEFVMIYPCHSMKGNQEWVYGPDQSLRHRNTNLCMELSTDGQKVDMRACSGVDRQIWYWKRKKPDHAQSVKQEPVIR